jgi:hypothetical protein
MAESSSALADLGVMLPMVLTLIRLRAVPAMPLKEAPAKAFSSLIKHG